jgi:hypothetical protein
MKPTYLVTIISRALSSGNESSYKRVFSTLEEATTYIHDEWYDEFCTDYDYPQYWDEEDMGAPFPKKEEFTFEVIKNKMENSKYNKRSITLFNYYSQYATLVPYELILEIVL